LLLEATPAANSAKVRISGGARCHTSPWLAGIRGALVGHYPGQQGPARTFSRFAAATPGCLPAAAWSWWKSPMGALFPRSKPFPSSVSRLLEATRRRRPGSASWRGAASGRQAPGAGGFELQVAACRPNSPGARPTSPAAQPPPCCLATGGHPSGGAPPGGGKKKNWQPSWAMGWWLRLPSLFTLALDANPLADSSGVGQWTRWVWTATARPSASSSRERLIIPTGA